MAVCWVILRGQQIYTVIQAVHSLLCIVAKCHFFSVVTWKDIIKYFQKCDGCTQFCERLYIYIYTLVDIWSGSKPFIKVVLKHKTKMRCWTFLIHLKCWLLYVQYIYIYIYIYIYRKLINSVIFPPPFGNCSLSHRRAPHTHLRMGSVYLDGEGRGLKIKDERCKITPAGVTNTSLNK